MTDNYFFDLHKDIIDKQGKTCKKCKRSLVFASRLEVIDNRMYCGACAREVRSLNRSKAEVAKRLSLEKAKAKYDAVRKK